MKYKSIAILIFCAFVTPTAFAQSGSEEIGGAGTPNFIAKFLSTHKIGNSIITESNGGIQVSSTSTAITGSTSGPDGAVAVAGFASGNSGFVTGVQGVTNSPQGQGGFFVNNSETGFASGVLAITNGPGIAVNGLTNNPGGRGVQGSSPNVGVAGFSQDCSNFPPCVSSPGVGGQFVTGAGGLILQGLLRSPSGDSFKQQFLVDADGNGFFAGNLNVTGTVSKGGGSFKIDHPLDPSNKTLSHSFVESPDMMNIYNGVTNLDAKGQASVTLPDWFESLNGDFRYLLTAIGAPQPELYIAEEVHGNRFRIAGGKPGAKVSWQVTGIRHDAYANAHRIRVEEDKLATQRGSYVHPEAAHPQETKGVTNAQK